MWGERNGVHSSQAPNLGNYLNGNMFIWKKGYNERYNRDGGGEGGESVSCLLMS